MGTSTPATTSESNQVVLPPGVNAGAARETSQVGSNGQVVQGVVIPITLPGGGNTTVFVPYSTLGSITQVQALFDTRINGLLALPGQGS